MTPNLKRVLDSIYAKAINPGTSDTYASALKREAKRACLKASLPRDQWPSWVEKGTPWQDRADRTQPVTYQRNLPKDVVAELEYHREHNNTAEARAICRDHGVPPPPWARR